MLVHLVDLSNPEGSAAADLATVERELAAFNPELMERPRLIVGSKLDAAVPERREELRRRRGGARARPPGDQLRHRTGSTLAIAACSLPREARIGARRRLRRRGGRGAA